LKLNLKDFILHILIVEGRAMAASQGSPEHWHTCLQAGIFQGWMRSR
jgi:hypothetical protein